MAQVDISQVMTIVIIVLQIVQFLVTSIPAWHLSRQNNEKKQMLREQSRVVDVVSQHTINQTDLLLNLQRDISEIKTSSSGSKNKSQE